MLSKTPTVSVIICNHVVGALFYKTIESVKRTLNVKIEIIVLTSSESLAKIGMSNCTVIHSVAGPAEKRNIGAKQANAPYLAFFDDDVDVNRNCIAELLKPLIENEKIAMTYGKLWNMEHRNRFDEAGGFLTSTGFIWSRAGQNDIDKGQYDEAEPVFAGKSAACMVRKDAFLEAGGFDNDFGILGEETDLSWRLWLKGHEVWYIPKATAYHAFNTKFKPVNKHYTTSRVQFNGCRNYITMLIKNLETKNLWKILPIHVLIWVGAGTMMLLTGKIVQGANIFKGIWYVLSHRKEILGKRGQIQSTRRVNDRTLWPYIFRRTSFGYYAQRFSKYIRIGLHG